LSHIGTIAGSVFANWLAVTFYVLFHSIYDIRLEGLENYTASPSSLITINHKRDLDIPVVASILHLRKTAFKNRLRMHFVARDDLFCPGFLTAHFPIFGITGKLVHRINLKPVMKALQAHPISQLVRNRISFLMREIMRIDGNLQLKQVIKPEGLEKFTQLLGMRNGFRLDDIKVSDFLGYSFCKLHHQVADKNILQGRLTRAIREKTLTAINEQLKDIALILDGGGICMLAPEGQLSPDGRFWPVKSGLFRLFSMTTSNIRVLPVNTTYDFMTRGRMRIYMTIGPELIDLRNYNKVELEQRVQKSIVTSGPITLGHLGSEYLLEILNEGRETFEELGLRDALSLRIEKLGAGNIRLEERLLTEPSLNRRVHDFLTYCVNKGIVSNIGNGSYRVSKSVIENDTYDKFHENPVRYSANELKSILELHAL